MNLDLDLLRVLVYLYEECSVTGAARRLGKSQPSISVALRKLRQTFKDELFVKAARGIEPTPRAKLLVLEAREILADVDQMLSNQRFEPASYRGTFTLALYETGELFFLWPLLKTLRQLAPQCQVSSIWPSRSDLVTGLASGEVDLAVGYLPDFRQGNFFLQKLYGMTPVCLVRAGHPLGNEKRLTFKQYLQLQHLQAGPGGRLNDLLHKILGRGAAGNRNVVVNTGSFASVAEIVANTDLAVTLQLPMAVYYANMRGDLKILKMPTEFPILSAEQVWHRKVHENPRNKWLRGLVSKVVPAEVRKILAEYRVGHS